MNTALKRAEEAERLAHNLLQFAADLRGQIEEGGAGGAARNLGSADEIASGGTVRALQAARKLYEARRKRVEFFADELFGEPAWDILLDLYIAFAEDRDISLGSLAIASHAPTSTAQRWIALLEAKGLIERRRSTDDARVQYARLTLTAARAMKTFLLRTECDHTTSQELFRFAGT